MRYMLLVLALGTALPASAKQFDLVCTGKERTTINGRWKPIEMRYKVDTDASLWCFRDCSTTRSIADVNDARLTFQETDKTRSSLSIIHYVDRTTGAWTYYFSGSAMGFGGEMTGSCEPQPFSGFAQAKF